LVGRKDQPSEEEPTNVIVEIPRSVGVPPPTENGNYSQSHLSHNRMLPTAKKEDQQREQGKIGWSQRPTKRGIEQRY
jgi:hypothetical protein